ncbi:hypothetical protein MA16_Dca017027 [Dendrobium catenatum]|uniref:Uncharacterized protein n=1 Tax=Dendrobium catenatum TaxID=906689 RepID=A0A2I0XEX4_9ASPA|nr:hypothetical protein MA16_Dca017027 [Dendrobium catenatum]
MDSNRVRWPLLLLLVITNTHFFPKQAEARPVSSVQQEGYVKELQLLGLMCRCCDGVDGECRSSWGPTCAKLDCKPWKFF